MIRYRTATMIVKFHHHYEKIKNNKGNGKVEYPKAHLKKRERRSEENNFRNDRTYACTESFGLRRVKGSTERI